MKEKISWQCQCTGKQHKRPNVRVNLIICRQTSEYVKIEIQEVELIQTHFAGTLYRVNFAILLGRESCLRVIKSAQIYAEDTIRPNFDG